MNKKLLSLLAILLVTSQMMAGPVDEATARKAGGRFAQTALNTTTRADEMRLVMTTDAFFVYNIGASSFVIVSADDAFRPIVGYSDEGAFPTENPSPEMMYYLDNLSQGRQAALEASYQGDAQTQIEWKALLEEGQLPSRNGSKGAFHLVQTKWNQGSPYNKFCPMTEGQGRSYAGCVATAMSQVMNYWKHPTQGHGHHSYFHREYGELSANFGEAYYDFDLMPNSISIESPAENIDAIALFMYHCGIAVNMEYSPSGSGSQSYLVPDAVLKYFGYTNCCRLIDRDEYSLGGFQALLKDQFDRGWPCYYSGQDTGGNGGHAFVCDGYDENDMFHFNWGWSGSGDGFYAIDELNVSSYAFNYYQGVVTNFVPREVFLNTASAPSLFTAVPNGDMDLSVTLSWTNPSTTLAGDALNTIDQLVVMRDNKVIYTLDNPTPGEAMTYVDRSGQPITVNYSVYAICQGVMGRSANANGINLGPTCEWTVKLFSAKPEGWDGGSLSFVNSSGVTVAELVPDQTENTYQVEMPQGWISMRYTAPADTLNIGIEIMDSEHHQVFDFIGLSTTMPRGTFFETVNTCGGEKTLFHPSNLKADVVDNDVVLSWTGIQDPGYGYVIYRDGLQYGMASEGTSFTDADKAQEAHSYYVTAFCLEGETDPSNTVCPIVDDDMAPRNLNAEILQNGKVKLTWERPLVDSLVAGFIVYRMLQGDEFKRVKIVGASTTSYTDNYILTDGDHYYYRVVSYLNREYVDSSPARSLTNPDLLYVEVNHTHIPSGLTIQEQNGQLQLQWDQAVIADSYNVYCNGEQLAHGLTETQFTDAVNTAVGLQVYYVTGVLRGVESSPSNAVYYGNYAVGENASNDVAVFPNPTKNLVTVQALGLKEITVFSMTGQKLLKLQADSNELTIDLSNYPSGVYYFNMATDQGIRARKVVLVK